jgi:hypothetical protein
MMITLPSSKDDIVDAGYREFGAFLGAVTAIFGGSFAQQASDLWLLELEKAGRLERDSPKFFCKITVRAASQVTRAILKREGAKNDGCAYNGLWSQLHSE